MSAMSMNVEEKLEQYRLPWESDDQWKLRKSFLTRHFGKYPSTNRLVCLSQVYINVEFLGCTYNKKVMDEVMALAEGLGDERREERRLVIQKTFVRGGELTAQNNAQQQSRVGSSDGREKIKNPFVPPPSKKSRESLDLPENPKSALVLKKEKMIIGARAVLTVASDPASIRMARQPLPESPIELLNYVCNREKISWKLEFAPREDEILEYFLSLDDVLIAHQFCTSKDEAQSSGCQIAIDRLSSVHVEVREETYNRDQIKLALYTARDKREGWNSPDLHLFSLLLQKLDAVKSRMAGHPALNSLDPVGTVEEFCEQGGVSLTIKADQKPGWKQELSLLIAGVVVSTLGVQGKELKPGNESHNRAKLCLQGMKALTQKNRRLFENDLGTITLEVLEEGYFDTDNKGCVALAEECLSRLDTCDDCVSGRCSVTPELVSRFIIKRLAGWDISLDRAKAIFIQSAQYCGLSHSIRSLIHPANGLKAAVTYLNETVIAESSLHPNMKEAEHDACFQALKKLQKHCFTIIQKSNIDKNQVEIGTDLAGKEKCDRPTPSLFMSGSVGKKLMEKMGWTGGGIGKKEQGIREPISVQKVFAREGLGRAASCGMGKHFTKAIEAVLQEYISSDKEEDLVFASDFSNEQRKQIHSLCRKMNLKSVSYGKDAERQLTVQKKKTAQNLLLMLIENGGENGKYLVRPPTAILMENR